MLNAVLFTNSIKCDFRAKYKCKKRKIKFKKQKNEQTSNHLKQKNFIEYYLRS